MLALALVPASAQAAGAGWQLIGATGPTNLPPVSSEIQEVAVDASGGTLQLSFNSQTTAALPFDATPEQMANALNALTSIGGVGGSVDVVGGPGDAGGGKPYFVLFGGALAGVNISPMSADSSGLSGGAANVSVSIKSEGGEPGEGIIVSDVTNVGGAASTGTVTLQIGPLPGGITTSSGAVGGGWTCPGGPGASEVTCTRTSAVPAATPASPVYVPVVMGAGAPLSGSVPMTVSEAAGASASVVLPFKVSLDKAEAGIQSIWAGAFDENGDPAVAAGGHPALAAAAFRVNTVLSGRGKVVPAGDLRDVKVDLPVGFVGNPTVTDHCPQSEPVPRSQAGGTLCGDNAIVGEAGVLVDTGGFFNNTFVASPIWNGDPPKGSPAQFGIFINEATVRLVGSLRSDEDSGVTIISPNIPQFLSSFGAYTGLSGSPIASEGKAILTNPTNCAEQAKTTPVTTIGANSWQVPDLFDNHQIPQPTIEGCDILGDQFKPEFAFQPASGFAAAGSSAEARLHIDQGGLTDPAELAPPHLKTSVVTLPQGMVLNPAAADGLKACSTQEIGLKGTNFAMPSPIRFDKNPVTCPDGSKIGTVEVETPLLEDPLAGTIYLAAQDDNPFKSLLAMYLVVEDEKTGTILKLPGEVTPDQATGQLTAEFDNNPQLPFSDLTLKFRGGGPRSTMATPDVCGKYTTKGTFTPWSAPESGDPAQTEDSFDITTGVGGSAACPQTKAQRPFGLGFEAGTTAPVAGGDSPFTLRITRPDGNQELDRITMKMPVGLTAKLAGVETCSDAALVQAMAPGRDGKTEMASPSCPANSQVGTTTIGAGVGSQPFYVKTGKVYLTGPYKGAPISLAFIVPAVAGPFDLGVQVVRTALQVNPTTAEITAESDPIPQILEGIPLQIRDVRVDIDRPGFTRNPTSCEPMAVSGQITGGSGAVANVNNRFQVGNCGALGFSPKLKLKYKGQTKVGGNPALRAVLTQPVGEANIAYTQVVLPNGSFIDNEHINNPCTRAQYAANACPKSSILGTATAWSPLLDKPLTGYVYFKSNGGERELPDIVASLKGQVNVELVGFIDAIENKKKGTSRVRNTFAIVPDAPVSRFELKMKGGKLGLIENSKNLCKNKKANKATVRMTAHNGKRIKREPIVQTSCKKKKRSKGSKKSANQRGPVSAELWRGSWG